MTSPFALSQQTLAGMDEAQRVAVVTAFRAAAAITEQREEEQRLRLLTYKANRRARKKSAPGSHTAAEVKALFLKQRSRCAYYGAKGCLGIITLAPKKKNTCHRDHIIPLALPGSSNWISNIQLTCGPCNIRKQALDPIVFAQRLGRLL